ncbi:Uncharacterised protein [Vibrio cholerae]|nr:Uncharacterised protein [Vibrio cholerae]CSA03906.1 Uncharacterised protein [Vibrio cholerae]
MRQQFIGAVVTKQDNFHIERDGLGIERNCASECDFFFQ